MINQQLIEYIKSSLAAGKSKEEIYKELLNNNWAIEVIQENFNLAEGDAGKVEAGASKEETKKQTVQIITIIGAILIGAGIFSFIASNWEVMTRTIKVLVIVVSMLAAYLGGWYLKESAGFSKTGEALILLGSIIYGGGIFLVAQMFNIQANWPDGFILWMIGIIIMGFASESYSLFSLSIPLGIIALIGHPFGIFTGFGYNQFLLTSSFLLLAAAIITFVAGWLVRKKMPPELSNFY